MRKLDQVTLFYCKLVFAVTVSQVLASAQVIEKVPNNFKLDGDIGEWNQDAPSFSRYAAREYKIWIGQSSQGLVFAGFYTFLPGAPAQKLALQIGLSAVDEIEMPPIGWGGWEPASEAGCRSIAIEVAERIQECIEWVRDQPIYREKLRGLFTRMWRVAPDGIKETHAKTIYESLTDAQRKAVKRLDPTGQPQAKFTSKPSAQMYAFEVLIPWEAFPPTDRLHLERIKTALSIVDDSDVTRASTASYFEHGPPPALRSFALYPAITAHLTPCDYPLAGLAGERAFYFLTQSLTVREAFVLQNQHVCCGAWVSPVRREAVSPAIEAVEYVVQTLAPGESICSPPLAYRKANVTKLFPLVPGSFTPSPAILRLPNGSRLIKNVPTWYYQRQSYTFCAGCPWASFSILALTPSGEIKSALGLGARVGAPPPDVAEYNIEMSSDWRTVTEFRMGPEGDWATNRYCLAGDVYQPCGHEDKSPPPTHGLMPPMPN